MRMVPSSTPPSILWLTQGSETLPSTRFRVHALQPLARERFGDAAVARIPKTFLRRLLFFTTLRPVDICVVQKRLLSFAELALLRQKSAVLAYDFDDAVWTEQDAPEESDKGRHSRRFFRCCAMADLVIAGNAFLAAAVPGGGDCHIMPTPIDTSVYVPGAGTTAEQPVIGWMGTASYLEWLEPVARRLAARGFPVHVVSNREPSFSHGDSVRFTPWSKDGERNLLQGFAVGLMPLEDSIYARGKGGFKLLQYMACGVVPVASAVGMNNDIITHGKDGFLVTREEEWEEYCARLADPELRGKMAAAARETAVRRFDIRKAAHTLFDRLRDLHTAKR